MPEFPDEKSKASHVSRGNLRRGYTTGACAAAATKAATVALMTQAVVSSVEIRLPSGEMVTFTTASCSVEPERALSIIVKDAGDDPDVTHGAEIGAAVEWTVDSGTVSIQGGKGVGVVTRPGLGLAIGSAAINPVPREMITRSVREAVGEREDAGVRVTIFVPQGEQLAKKTLNARLGIVGGISILGTTGIVVPYSTAAYKACITQAIDVALANGCQHLVLTTGRRSERFAQKLLDLPEESFVQVADFSGFAVEQCARKGVRRVTFCGMVGKLSKIAAGHRQTHVDKSRMDHGFLAHLAAEEGLPAGVVASIKDGNTARQFAEIVGEYGNTSVFSRISRLAAEKLSRFASGSMDVECVMTDFDGEVLGRGSLVGNRPHYRRR